jgi:hypothetical protein
MGILLPLALLEERGLKPLCLYKDCSFLEEGWPGTLVGDHPARGSLAPVRYGRLDIKENVNQFSHSFKDTSIGHFKRTILQVRMDIT